MNSRLDTIQAAILEVKLEAFKNYELEARQKFALMYTEKLKDYVKTPFIDHNYTSSLQTVYKDYQEDTSNLEVSKKLCDTVLSIPMHPYLNGELINDIANHIIDGLEAFKNE